MYAKQYVCQTGKNIPAFFSKYCTDPGKADTQAFDNITIFCPQGVRGKRIKRINSADRDSDKNPQKIQGILQTVGTGGQD